MSHDSKRVPRWLVLCVTSVATIVIVAGVLQRLAVFQRELWLDEAGHNLRLLVDLSLKDKLIDIGWDRQPILDYVLRKLVWIPLFGHQERGLKLPALLFSVATLFAVAVLSFRRLSRSLPSAAVLVGTCLVLVWCAGQPTEVWYAGEARHYAFVSLCSLLWTDWFVFRRSVSNPIWFWGFSFVFACVHFFALALIAGALLLEAAMVIRQRRWRALATMAAASVLLAVVYGVINYYGLVSLYDHTYGQLPPVSSAHDLVLRVWHGCSMFGDFSGYAAAPWWPLGVWAVLALAGVFVGDVESRPIARASVLRLALLWSSLAAVLIAARLTSGWAFSMRYFTPFFGACWVTMVLGFSTLAQLAQAKWIGGRPAKVAFALLMGSGAVAVLASGAKLFRYGRRPEWPPENFSATEALFEREKARGTPLLVVAEPCYSSRVFSLYWNQIGRAPAPGSTLQFTSSESMCSPVTPMLQATPEAAIRSFLSRPGPKTVALYRYHTQSCPALPATAGRSFAVESAACRDACLTLLRDPPDLDAVKAVAEERHFPL